MEFTIQEYKRSLGKVVTTPDGYNYVHSKITEDCIYLKCSLFRCGCKGTSKLNRSRNLVTPTNSHNHSVDDYKAGVYQLKTRCKTLAKHSQTNLREVFDDATRNDPHAADISFVECESVMYRARRTLQPKIPSSAAEFCEMLATSTFKDYYKFSVTQGIQTAVIFYSDEMITLLIEAENIQFDGTFQTVPIQFYQLWTIFVAVGGHTMPAIHCLMTGKSQELYSAILRDLVLHVPQFQPIASMSDWEPAPRNAFREFYPQMKLYGCWFHYTQRIWAKTQKLGLSQSFKNDAHISKFIRQLMAIPFLPAALIAPTFTLIEIPAVPTEDVPRLEKLMKYFKKRWLHQISPEELSIHDITISTNNGAESYHSKLKSRIRCNHPRIWTFITKLNEIIQDTDNDIRRLYQGREISRQRCKTDIKNEEQRIVFKQKLSDGQINPWEFLQSMSHTVGNIKTIPPSSESECSEGEDEDDDQNINTEPICVVCLSQRSNTWVFIPCRHASFCGDCSERIVTLGQNCPICRSNIDARMEIFTN